MPMPLHRRDSKGRVQKRDQFLRVCTGGNALHRGAHKGGLEKLLSMFVRVSADEPIAIGHPHIGQSLGIQHVVVANDFV
jgi:hypothetical protein